MKAAVHYDESIASQILERLAGGDPLRRICADPAMPCLASVMRWLADKVDFRQRYAIARLLQADHLADEILSIVDESGGDVKVDEKGKVQVLGDVIQRAKLRVDTRKWLMARLAPKKYGDKQLAGEMDEDEGLVVQVVRYDSDQTAE